MNEKPSPRPRRRSRARSSITPGTALGRSLLGTWLIGATAACSQGPAAMSASVTGYAVVTADGTPLVATAGDTVRLTVVQTLSDGTTATLPAAAKVAWSGPPTVHALASGSAPATSALPPAGAPPAAFLLVGDTDHYSDAELAGVLWIVDRGTDATAGLAVTATVSGVTPAGTATATVSIAANPVGDAGRGSTLYSANCAACHGATGHGMATFPGLNNESGHVAGDPAWNAALLTMTARSDMDNMGVSLDPSMPKWLTRTSANGKTLTTQNFADIWAFLKTQNN